MSKIGQAVVVAEEEGRLSFNEETQTYRPTMKETNKNG